jgi:glyoxylase-like metal-dependent hydrolase (beta-lactamase superfamily II)
MRPVSPDPLYFRQLLVGVDIARTNPRAAAMRNFVYLVGDRERGEAIVIDPAWAVAEIVDILERDGMRLTGALVTHYHPDHVGGALFGGCVEGLAELLARAPCPIHAHRLEAAGVRQVAGLSSGDLVAHDSGDRVAVGGLAIELLHTPGHTPGSLCFRLGERLIAGDTLFLRGCGRVDLPGGDVDEMYRTLTQRLGALPAETVVYPGHDYGGHSAPMGELRQRNSYLQVRDLQTWRRMLAP